MFCFVSLSLPEFGWTYLQHHGPQGVFINDTLSCGGDVGLLHLLSIRHWSFFCKRQREAWKEEVENYQKKQFWKSKSASVIAENRCILKELVTAWLTHDVVESPVINRGPTSNELTGWMFTTQCATFFGKKGHFTVRLQISLELFLFAGIFFSEKTLTVLFLWWYRPLANTHPATHFPVCMYEGTFHSSHSMASPSYTFCLSKPQPKSSTDVMMHCQACRFERLERHGEQVSPR